jgi:hypothetical protein
MNATLQIIESHRTDQYVRNVHWSMGLKLAELRVIAQRLEPDRPAIIGARERPPPSTADIRHALRRYDNILMTRKGFSYNTQRAYFPQDPLRTGRVLFEHAVDRLSLLGTTSEDDKIAPKPFNRNQELPYHMRSRVARTEAMFTLLERRQAFSGAYASAMAPLSLFVGNRAIPVHHTRPSVLHRDAPLLPQHRYYRICVLMWLQNVQDIAVVVAERRTTFFDLHIMIAGSIHGPNQQAIAADVARYWEEYIIDAPGAHPPIFSTPVPRDFRMIQQDMVWPMIVDDGDSELFYRLALLLESPTLTDFRPWESPLPHRSLSALLEAYPVNLPPPPKHKTDPPITLDLLSRGGAVSSTAQLREHWLTVVLMLRVYPYTLLAHDAMVQSLPEDMVARGRTNKIVGFTAEEHERFKALIVKNDRAAEEPAESMTSQSALTIGAKQKLWERLLMAKKNKKKPPKTEDIEIKRVPKDSAQTQAVTKSLVPSAVYVRDRSDAELARFVAVRKAQEATQNQEPLLALKGWVPAKDAYRYARRWREKILRSSPILRQLGRDCLTFLYGEGGKEVWRGPIGNANPHFPRLAWEERVEYRTPKPGTERYHNLLRLQPSVPALANTTEREALLAVKERPAVGWLATVAVGVAPSSGINRQVELEFIMSSVLVSLAKDSLLLLGLEDRDRGEFLPRLQRLGDRAAVRELASFALLAWEWGREWGVRDFLSWLDDLWEAEVAPVSGQGLRQRRATRALLDHFPVFSELGIEQPQEYEEYAIPPSAVLEEKEEQEEGDAPRVTPPAGRVEQPHEYREDELECPIDILFGPRMYPRIDQAVVDPYGADAHALATARVPRPTVVWRNAVRTQRPDENPRMALLSPAYRRRNSAGITNRSIPASGRIDYVRIALDPLWRSAWRCQHPQDISYYRQASEVLRLE